MQAKILITDNADGNHSADTWAMAAAEFLADATGLDQSRHLEGQRLQLKFAEVLFQHFGACSHMEKSKLKSDAKHVLTELHEQQHVDVDLIADELAQAAAGTQWAEHYKQAPVKAAVKQELRHLLHSSMHLDRLVHVDNNPDCKHAQAYRAKHGA